MTSLTRKIYPTVNSTKLLFCVLLNIVYGVSNAIFVEQGKKSALQAASD